jgi:thiol-disulfide isomerase/thioredoxin
MALKTKEPGKIKFWSPLRVVSTVIVLGLIAAFGISSCNSNDVPVTTSKPGDPARPGAEAAARPLLPAVALDTEMKGINGESIKLSNYSGKVLLVNLWATWCGPCRNEIPELVRLHKEYQSRGVEMIGLTTEDPVSSAQIVQEFVRNFKVDYQVGWAPREVAAALMQGRGSIPQSLIVTRDGRITKRFVGFHPRETPPLLKKALEEALIDNG